MTSESTEVGTRALAVACADTRARYPELAFDDEDFANDLVRRASTDGLETYLARCNVADLALSMVAARGNSVAIAILEREHHSAIDNACRRFANYAQSADDLRQILRERLFAGERPKLAEYSGFGMLSNWLRVTAVRLFIDLAKRRDRAREAPSSESGVLALPAPEDLGLELIKNEHRALVARAMADAVATLAPGDRHLLRMHFVMGLSIDQLGAALGTHRATAARRIAKARDQLVTEIRASMASTLQLDGSELDSVITSALSRLDISVGRLLASHR